MSRWERGESRPRDREFPRIADVLSADVGKLLSTAGYPQSPAAATFDRPFPLGSLFPDSFERFALHFLAALYPNAKVHPAGKSGHKQYGLDVEVIFPDGRVHTYQCKREERFGPSQVSQAYRRTHANPRLQVLRALGDPENAAKQIAEAAFDSPLAVVIGAQIVAKDRVHPELSGSHEDFRSTVLKRYEKVISEDIASGQDQDRIRRILRVLALIQPVVPEDRPTLDLLSKIEGIEPADASRLTRRLIESGVLFKRGIKHRLSPDLLADSIIESACITSTGSSNGYAEKVFDASIPEHMEHVLLNLGRLDWRRNEGDTSQSPLLDDLWSRLEWREKHLNPHVDAASAAAFYQPRQALAFATRLIRSRRTRRGR